MTTEQADELIALAERTALATEQIANLCNHANSLTQVLTWNTAAAAGGILAIIVVRGLMVKNLWT